MENDQKNIVWLASYPRSGNTYLRFLVNAYFFGEVTRGEEVDENIHEVHAFVSGAFGAGAKLRPYPCFMKTHYPFSPAHPLIGMSRQAVYLVRNPRDVLLSCARYVSVIDDQPHMDLAEFSRAFIDGLGARKWKESGFGSWPENVASWQKAASAFPCLFLTYEELLRNPAATLARLVTFVGESPDNEKIAQAVAASSIEVMRKLEVQDRERPKGKTPSPFEGGAPDRPFVGNGAINQSLGFIGADVEKSFQEKFGPIISVLGYA